MRALGNGAIARFAHSSEMREYSRGMSSYRMPVPGPFTAWEEIAPTWRMNFA